MSCDLQVREFFKDQLENLRELSSNKKLAEEDLANFEKQNAVEISQKINEYADKYGSDTEAFRKKSQELLNKNRESKIERRLEQIDTAIIASKFKQQHLSSAKGDPRKNLAAMIFGDKAGTKGEADSFDSRYNLLRNELTTYFRQTFTDSEVRLLSQRKATEVQDNVEILVLHMNENGRVPESIANSGKFSDFEIQLAKKAKSYYDFEYKKKLEAGLNVGHLDNFAGERVYSKEKVVMANPDYVKQRFKQSMDLDDTFPDLKGYTDKKTGKFITVDEQIDDIIGSTVSNMRERHFDNPHTLDINKADTQQRSSLSSRIEKSRKYKFIPEEWVKFRKEFGANTFGEGILQSIDKTSRRVALVQKFGKNPAATFNKIRRDISKWADANNRTDLVGKSGNIDSTGFTNASLNDSWRTATGDANISVNPNVSTIGANIRAWKYMAILGKTQITAMNDWTSMAATLSAKTGQNPLKGFADIATAIVTQATEAAGEIGTGFRVQSKQSKAFRRKLSDFKFAIDSHMGANFRRIGLDESAKTSNLINHIQNYYEILNPIGIQQNAHKNMFSTAYLSEIGGQIADGKIHPNTWKAFKRVNVTEEYGPALKAMVAKFDDYPDSDILLPGSVDRISDEMALDIIGKLKKSDPTISTDPVEFRRDLEQKLSILNIEAASDAVPTPGLKQQIQFQGSIVSGTAQGEIIKSLTPLKSMALKMYDVTRNILNASDSKADKMKYMSSYLMSGYGIAYVSLAIKDILTNKTPRDINDPATIREALMIAGAGGLLADLGIQLTDPNGRSTLDSIAGPVVGTGVQVAQMAGQTLVGDPPSGKQLTNFMIQNTPFGNHLLFRPAADLIFLEDYRNSIDSKRQRRINKRMRQRGQESIWR